MRNAIGLCRRLCGSNVDDAAAYNAETYVIGTGDVRNSAAIVRRRFGCVGLDWAEACCCRSAFIRLTETVTRLPTQQKQKTELGWSPRTSFTDLVKMMGRKPDAAK